MNIDRQRMCHGFAAVTLLALTAWAPPSLALGEGFLPPCATLGNCSADLASGAAWSVRESVTNITGGFAMPTDLQAGVTTQQGQDVKLNASPELAGNGPLASNLNFALTEFYRGTAAQAQTDFGVNRVRTGQNSGVAGELTRGTGSATVRLETYASASSACSPMVASVSVRALSFQVASACDSRPTLAA